MPKNPLKNFARRKSSGNVLDIPSESTPPAPAGSSFRVLERPDKAAPATAGSGGYAVGANSNRTSGGRPGSAFLLNKKSGKSQEDLIASANRSVPDKSQVRPHTIYGVLNRGRGSGGTALSGSSGYFDTSSSSARYSSSSTLPSSIEAEHEAEQEDLFPRKNANANATNASTPSNRSSAASNALPEPPSFTARAGRAMSFGLRNKQNPSPGTMTAATAYMPDLPENSLIRDRATTMSSNASTAVPPRLDANLGSMSDFGSDFGMNMFEGLSSPRHTPASAPKNEVVAPLPTHANFGRSVRRQQSPGFGYNDNSTHNNNNTHYYNNNQNHYQNAYQQRPHLQESESVLAAPSRNSLAPSPEPEPEPEPRHRPTNLSAAAANRYSWASRTSNDGLMSPALGSDISSPPLQPPSTFARFKPGYQPVPDRYGSPANEHERAVSSSSEEDVSRPISRTRSPLVESYTAHTSPQRGPPAARNPTIAAVSRDDLSSTDSIGESQNTTPRALRPQSNTEESLFDHSPAGPTSRAVHPAAVQVAPRSQSQQFSPTKRMTRKEFEAQRAEVNPEENEESEDSEDGNYDDDDEAERQAELARTRRKQEANLSVYRQQMKKVSGGNPSELPSHQSRPSLDRASHSAPGLIRDISSASLGAEQEEEDDEVPLGILQAHGFPNKNRPPTRLGSAPATPGAGSVVNGMGGNLPVFARNLPADPYFGASIVNPTNRESLPFTSGGSVYGGSYPSVVQQPQMPQMMAPPQMPGMPQAGGGLVGVIAGEERARAARRANPNQGAGFNANGMPLPNNLLTNMPAPQMPRSNSMMNMPPPQMPMGGFMPQMPQYPQMPGMMSPEQSNQQQMMQLMMQQQQMMQQMIGMQLGQQMPPQMNSPQMQNGGFPNMMPNGMQRPVSMGGPNGQQSGMLSPQFPMHQQQRSSTMTNLKPPGYAGSIYDYSLGAPRGGYTPSIAPSERSNVGMPSRYRPVTMEGSNSRTASMTSQSNIQSFAKKNASTGSLLNPSNIPQGPGSNVPRTTIKVIDKPKGSPRSPQPRADDDDDEEGWAQLRKKREARKKRATKTQEQTLDELYQGFE